MPVNQRRTLVIADWPSSRSLAPTKKWMSKSTSLASSWISWSSLACRAISTSSSTSKSNSVVSLSSGSSTSMSSLSEITEFADFRFTANCDKIAYSRLISAEKLRMFEFSMLTLTTRFKMWQMQWMQVWTLLTDLGLSSSIADNIVLLFQALSNACLRIYRIIKWITSYMRGRLWTFLLIPNSWRHLLSSVARYSPEWLCWRLYKIEWD